MAKIQALSVQQCLTQKGRVLNVSNRWRASVGEPETGSAWMVWGASSSGKTSFVLQLCKELCRAGLRVAYNSMEEGVSKSFTDAMTRAGMDECRRKFVVLDSEPMEDVAEWLKKRRTADALVIDSIQYSGMNYAQYKELRRRFRNKVLIIVSHAEKKEPQGATARRIRYDASVKIRVEGYKAFISSRYGGGEPFTIWEDGAVGYWGFKQEKQHDHAE